MDKGEERLLRENALLRLLLRPLDSLCPGCSLPARIVSILVVYRLLPDGAGYCLVQRLSVAIDVPADE
ncbi:MAG: hypothetical protein OEV42_07815 [Deltaproteobacteria bacterium]|nr:hypothetical protein [Deltaproteobacteria bacterium]